MTADRSPPPNHPPGAAVPAPALRGIAAVLLLKLAILLTIRALWFDQPVLPANADAQVGVHLLGNAQPTSLPPNEESPR